MCIVRIRVIVLLLVALASPAAAQLIDRPPRSTGGPLNGRPTPPGPSSQELTLTLNLLGGFDDSLTLDGTPILFESPEAQRSGYVSTATGALRYWKGRSNKFFETSGRAYLSSYPAYSDLGAGHLFGGDVTIRGRTELGPRARLSGSVGGLYQPTFLFGAFGPVSAQVDSTATPEASATLGVTEQHWLTGMAGAGLEYDWNGRHESVVQYEFADRQAQHRVGRDDGVDDRTQGVMVRQGWNFNRDGSLRTTYRFLDERFGDDVNQTLPFRSHRLDVGVLAQKRWSATRRLEVGGGVGATLVDQFSAVGNGRAGFVVPSTYASFRVDIARTWALSADARHDVTILQGLTPQPFVSNAMSLTAGGLLSRRVDFAMTASLSQGIASEGDVGSFEGLTGIGQLQWNLSRRLAMTTSYTYYRHILEDVAFVPLGFPRTYSRNSVRVGLTARLPLSGRSRPPR